MDGKTEKGRGLTRRDFLEGTGATLVVAGAAPKFAGAESSEEAANLQAAGTAPRTRIRLTVNGTEHRIEVEDRWTLNEVLRDQLELTGSKIGCNRGECGACTVLVDGEPTYSCSTLAVWMDGRAIETVEGLEQDDELTPLQQAFIDHDAAQCGFCTPGMIMTTEALLKQNPNPTEDEIRTGIAGNFCRCTGYQNIVNAIGVAAKAGR